MFRHSLRLVMVGTNLVIAATFFFSPKMFAGSMLAVYMMSAFFLAYLAHSRIERLLGESSLEDAAAEAGLLNFHADADRSNAVRHYKCLCRSRLRFFIDTVLLDFMPLIIISCTAAVCGLSVNFSLDLALALASFAVVWFAIGWFCFSLLVRSFELAFTG